MKIPFVKMHGSSNDFILVDEWKDRVIEDEEKTDFVAKASDRRTGVGSDGVIFLQKSNVADAKFVFYNPDGSPAEMCGNGIRCLAKYLYDSSYYTKLSMTVETLAGVKRLDITLFNDKVDHVRVDMGAPQVYRGEIGISGNPKDTFINQEVSVEGKDYRITSVGMGNPHAVLFVENIDRIDVVEIGRKIRNFKETFSKGVNVHFVQEEGKQKYKIRSYERGVEDETLACGTGVCAAAVAAVLNDTADRTKKFRFFTRGGELNVEFKLEGDKVSKVFLIGPAVEVFTGEFEYDPTEGFQKAAYSFIRTTLPKE